MNKDKVGTTIYLDKEVKEDIHLNPNIKNLSDEINEYYKEKYLSIPSKIKRIEYLSQLLEDNKIELQKLKAQQQNALLISPIALNWIKNEGAISIKKGKNFDAVLRLCNDRFKISLSRNQFRLIIEKLKEEKET